MNKKKWRKPLIASALLAVARFSTAAQSLDLASTIDPAQGPASGGGRDSRGPVISADGRYVLFASTANNLMLATNNNPIPVGIPASLNVFLAWGADGESHLTCRITDVWNPECYLMWGPDANTPLPGLPIGFYYNDGAMYPDKHEGMLERLH